MSDLTEYEIILASVISLVIGALVAWFVTGLYDLQPLGSGIIAGVTTWLAFYRVTEL